jgi:predicted GTPase
LNILLHTDQQNNYYPGEINTRLADMVILSKVKPDSEALEAAEELATNLKPILQDPSVPVLFGGSTIKPEGTHSDGTPMTEDEAAALIKDKKVLVVDDGPTLTHGGKYVQ